MDYYERIQSTVDYIEKRLGEEITLDELADMACFSKYHYHRIFLAFTGETVMEYIRKRRLASAAARLMNSGDRTLDIAFSLGFNSQETFIRAFKKVFGVTPGRCRKDRSLIDPEKCAAPARIMIKAGGIMQKPEIVKKESFYVVGMECTTTVDENKAGKVIPKLWEAFMPRMGEIAACCATPQERPGAKTAGSHHGGGLNPHPGVQKCQTAFGVCFCEGENREFKYVAGVETTASAKVPDGMVKKLVPAAKYAVFKHRGPIVNFYDTLDYIYGKWAPTSGFELDRTACDFELYDERFTNDAASEVDIYVPIR